MMEDRLYEKYRVFKEPDDVHSHPCMVRATYTSTDPEARIQMSSKPLEEVTDFCFVLKPNKDKAAKIALGVYASLVEESHPHLAEDLRIAIEEY